MQNLIIAGFCALTLAKSGSTASAQPRPGVEAVALTQLSAKELMRLVRLAEGRSGIAAVLDRHQPRFWNELTKTGKAEAIEAIDAGLNEEGEADSTLTSRSTLVQRALRFARINDALDEGASLSALVSILDPELTADLGYGRGTSIEILQDAASDLAEAAGRGIFTSLGAFEESYSESVHRHWSGR